METIIVWTNPRMDTRRQDSVWYGESTDLMFWLVSPEISGIAASMSSSFWKVKKRRKSAAQTTWGSGIREKQTEAF